MPANILADMNTLSAGLEDQRALQIALELTKLGLNHQNNNQNGGGNNDGNNHHQHHGDGTPPTSASSAAASTTVASGYDRDTAVVVPEGGGAAGGGGGGVVGSRKSANMTECVPVPSSEHVAEIVGRQGCKIKALRAKTNTYIKTPVRGEEPVFVVTGRKEDVAQAKREILSAAEHFSQIRASRRNNNAGSGAGGPAGLLPGPGNPNLPGQVTIQVRVPYRVVGLVVGPKGATIKRIQQQTHTYIVTPNRDKEPIFEVTGLPDSVEKARQEIEGHIAMRTGAISAGGTDASLNNHINNLHSGGVGNLNVLHGAGTKGGALDDGRSTDFQANGIDAGFHELTTNIMFGSLYNGGGGGSNGTGGSGTGTGGSGGANSSSKLHAGLSSAFTPYSKAPAANNSNNQSNNLLSQHLGGDGSSVPHDGQVFPFSTHHLDTSLPKYNDVGVLTTSSAVGLYDSDEGIGGSPTFDSATAPLALPSASIWSDLSSDSQGSDFGALFTGMNSHQRHLAALDSSPCVSLPQLSFGALAPSSADLTPTMATDQECVRRINSDPLNLATTLALLQNASGVPSPGAGGSTLASTCTSVCSSLSLSESAASSLHSGSASSSPTEPTATALVAPSRPRHCVLCGDGDVTAVPVPCGHNAFCKDCAEKLVRDNADSDGRCPICQQAPSQAIRIFS